MYGSGGGAARVAAARRAAASNDPAALEKLLVDSEQPMGRASDDAILTRPVSVAGDGEQAVSLHQLAAERHPRRRGRVVLDAASVLSRVPEADRVPPELPPWQRPDAEPKTLAMVRALNLERDSDYAPLMPPQPFWDNRSARARGDSMEPADLRVSSATAADLPLLPVDGGTGEARVGRFQGDGLLTTPAPETMTLGFGHSSARPGVPRWPLLSRVEEELRVAKADIRAARQHLQADNESEEKCSVGSVGAEESAEAGEAAAVVAGEVARLEERVAMLQKARQVERGEDGGTVAASVAAAEAAAAAEARRPLSKAELKLLTADERIAAKVSRANAVAKERANAQLAELRQASDSRAWEVGTVSRRNLCPRFTAQPGPTLHRTTFANNGVGSRPNSAAHRPCCRRSCGGGASWSTRRGRPFAAG